jgi:LysM repeat protein
MQRRGLIAFVLLNILVTAAVAFAVVNLTGGRSGAVTERLVTFEVLVTTTPNPNVTPQVIIVTPTPEGGRATLPPDVLEGTSPAVANVPTLDPTLLSADTSLQGTGTALPSDCVPHPIADGENPSIIADIYGVSVFDLLAVNGLTEEDAVFLQIGQVLIVPLEGCDLVPVEPVVVSEETEDADAPSIAAASSGTPGADDDATEEATAELTPELSPTPTIRPTITLAPTATNAQVTIDQVLSAGDITREEVVIRNTGNTINLTGWTLSDGDGNLFVFDERRLFSGATVRINTRAGQNTPVVLYWGRQEAVFAPGDVVVLADANGNVQATLRLPAAGN